MMMMKNNRNTLFFFFSLQVTILGPRQNHPLRAGPLFTSGNKYSPTHFELGEDIEFDAPTMLCF